MSLSSNDLRSRIQKYLEDVPVLVVGSGLSCAEGLPGMGVLGEHLAQNISPSSDEVSTWSEVCSRLETAGLEASLQAVPVSDSLRQKVVRATHDLILERERAAIGRALQGAALPLARFFDRCFGTTEKKVTVVTTNYDRLVEVAAEQAGGVVYSGFTVGGIRSKDNENRWQLVRRTPNSKCERQRTVDVWKVHGSLDWFATPTGTRATSFVSEMLQYYEPVMVTPGNRKYEETHQEPYRSIVRHADRAMNEAKGFLCLGYGFNDNHVQPNLLARARDDLRPAPVVLLTQELTPAAKVLLIDERCPKYVALTRSEFGTRCFTDDYPEGVDIPDVSLWQLTDLLDWIWGAA